MAEWARDEVLTTDEASRYLRISKPTFLKWVRLGKINALKIGNGWRVLRSEIDGLLSGKKLS
jgi:excisionase family DNA binding protein